VALGGAFTFRALRLEAASVTGSCSPTGPGWGDLVVLGDDVLGSFVLLFQALLWPMRPYPPPPPHWGPMFSMAIVGPLVLAWCSAASIQPATTAGRLRAAALAIFATYVVTRPEGPGLFRCQWWIQRSFLEVRQYFAITQLPLRSRRSLHSAG